MTLTPLDTLIVTSAIGAGVIGGTFFGFSSFVMGALGRLPAPQGIAAMQSINVVVINPWFMTPFLGTAVLGLAIAVAVATPTTTEAAQLWARYLVSWTFWNHVRTVAALGAMVSFMVAFRLRA